MPQIKTLHEKEIETAIKKDREETLRLVEAELSRYSSQYNPAADKIVEILKSRAAL